MAIIEGPFRFIVNAGRSPWTFKNHSFGYQLHPRIDGLVGPSQNIRYNGPLWGEVFPTRFSGDMNLYREAVAGTIDSYGGGSGYYGASGDYFITRIMATQEAPDLVSTNAGTTGFRVRCAAQYGSVGVFAPTVLKPALAHAFGGSSLTSAPVIKKLIVTYSTPLPVGYRKVMCGGVDVTNRVMWATHTSSSTTLYMSPVDYPSDAFTVELYKLPRGDYSQLPYPIPVEGWDDLSFIARVPHTVFKNILVERGPSWQGPFTTYYQTYEDNRGDMVAAMSSWRSDVEATMSAVFGQPAPVPVIESLEGVAPSYIVRPDARVRAIMGGDPYTAGSPTGSYSSNFVIEGPPASSPGAWDSTLVVRKAVTQARASGGLMVVAQGGTSSRKFQVIAAYLGNAFDPATGPSLGGEWEFTSGIGTPSPMNAIDGDFYSQFAAGKHNIPGRPPLSQVGEVSVVQDTSTNTWVVDPNRLVYSRITGFAFTTQGGSLSVEVTGTDSATGLPRTDTVALVSVSQAATGFKARSADVAYTVDYSSGKQPVSGPVSVWLYDCVKS